MEYNQQILDFLRSFLWDKFFHENFFIISLSSIFLLSYCSYKLYRRLSSKILFTKKVKKEKKIVFEEKFCDKMKLNITNISKRKLAEIFFCSVDQFMADDFDQFLKVRSPILFQDLKTYKIKFKCYPSHERNRQIEELYTFWELGFRHPKLPLILMIYLFPIEKDDIKSILLKFLNYPGINISQKSLLWLYFQDILKKPVDITRFPVEEIETHYQTENLLFSKIISSHEYPWNIITFREQVRSFCILKEIEAHPPMKELLVFLISKSTRMLRSYIALNFTRFLGKIGEKIILETIFKFGNYQKLLKIPDISGELKIFILSIFQNNQGQDDLRISKSKKELIIKYLSQQRYPKLHIFYYLKAINASIDTITKYGMNDCEIKNIMEHPKLLPLGMRWIFFQYLVYLKKWKKGLIFYESLGIYRNQVAGKLFRLRCLFHDANDKEKYFQEIRKLLDDHPDNLSVVNEYAVYCINMNKTREAQKIFKKMQKQSGDHPVVLYNQALLFENLYSEAIKQRWRKFDQVKFL